MPGIFASAVLGQSRNRRVPSPSWGRVLHPDRQAPTRPRECRPLQRRRHPYAYAWDKGCLDGTVGIIKLGERCRDKSRNPGAEFDRGSGGDSGGDSLLLLPPPSQSESRLTPDVGLDPDISLPTPRPAHYIHTPALRPSATAKSSSSLTPRFLYISPGQLHGHSSQISANQAVPTATSNSGSSAARPPLRLNYQSPCPSPPRHHPHPPLLTASFVIMRCRNILAAVLSAGVAAALPAADPLAKKSVDFAWGTEIVRGLNIGGWLLLEPWITPSIFQAVDQSLGIVDEYTLTQKLGSDAAYDILKPHWDSWCTFKDFERIAEAGFNTVRIPVGYWAYSLESGEPYTQGAAPYVDAAIDWARATGLKVWIDLHGAPLSQNGFDNSGHRISEPGWQGGNSTAQTLAVLKIIADKYAQAEYQDVVVAIELLNEPMSSALDFVVVDHHEYQVFTHDLLAQQPWEHRQKVCNNVASYASGVDKWLVVGEWSGAMTDCAPALNGYGIGARYDGTFPNSSYIGSCADKNDLANWNETFKNDMRGYLEAQLSTFERHTQGWVFWTFKTEAAHEWDAFKLLEAGIFPQPLTSYKYDSICS
ncbi:hypothetical protein B2J93_7099 [Marssonina coronariae]|uniref:Glycoside hydrolase family 5 domain-containing protein n=1 Tax=Diplocarpon coronariae TaxID=2795749 RepID=A0A218YTW1_9HELO|nr:hypothetical protein B2J93_7099 [Marssonina coronariae]